MGKGRLSASFLLLLGSFFLASSCKTPAKSKTKTLHFHDRDLFSKDDTYILDLLPVIHNGGKYFCGYYAEKYSHTLNTDATPMEQMIEKWEIYSSGDRREATGLIEAQTAINGLTLVYTDFDWPLAAVGIGGAVGATAVGTILIFIPVTAIGVVGSIASGIGGGSTIVVGYRGANKFLSAAKPTKLGWQSSVANPYTTATYSSWRYFRTYRDHVLNLPKAKIDGEDPCREPSEILAALKENKSIAHFDLTDPNSAPYKELFFSWMGSEITIAQDNKRDDELSIYQGQELLAKFDIKSWRAYLEGMHLVTEEVEVKETLLNFWKEDSPQLKFRYTKKSPAADWMLRLTMEFANGTGEMFRQ